MINEVVINDIDKGISWKKMKEDTWDFIEEFFRQ